MLNLNILSYLESSVDPDQQALKKPADLDPRCFQLCITRLSNTVESRIKSGGIIVHKNIQLDNC